MFFIFEDSTLMREEFKYSPEGTVNNIQEKIIFLVVNCKFFLHFSLIKKISCSLLAIAPIAMITHRLYLNIKETFLKTISDWAKPMARRFEELSHICLYHLLIHLPVRFVACAGAFENELHTPQAIKLIPPKRKSLRGTWREIFMSNRINSISWHSLLDSEFAAIFTEAVGQPYDMHSRYS